MKNMIKLASAAALTAAMATTAYAGSPAPTPVEPDVFVAQPSSGGMSPWAIAGGVLAAAAIIALIADDDDSSSTTTAAVE